MVTRAGPLLHATAPGDHYPLCEKSPALMREQGDEISRGHEATCLACVALLPPGTAWTEEEVAGFRRRLDELVTTPAVLPAARPAPALIHIAGPDIQVGSQLRQRCAWCGAVLIDYALERIAVPVGQDPRPGRWAPGALVAVDGGASWAVEHEDGAELPPEACAQLDHSVTG